MYLTKIRELCEKNQISISALERKNDISHGTINRWNKSKPTAEHLYRVAKYFNVPMETFFEGE